MLEDRGMMSMNVKALGGPGASHLVAWRATRVPTAAEDIMTSSPRVPSTKISAVVSDVDGTLVTDDKVLTPRAQAAVAALHARGIVFTVISARPPRGLRMLLRFMRRASVRRRFLPHPPNEDAARRPQSTSPPPAASRAPCRTLDPPARPKRSSAQPASLRPDTEPSAAAAYGIGKH